MLQTFSALGIKHTQEARPAPMLHVVERAGIGMVQVKAACVSEPKA